MIGPLEIVILLVIILLVTGAYKKLPQLGRSAGTNARIGSEKAREFADKNAPKAKELAAQVSTKGGEVGAKVNEKVGDRLDAESLGRQAGKGVREARDMRASFKGMLDSPPKQEAAAKPDPAPAPRPGPAPPAESEAAEPAGDALADAAAPGPAADAERRPDADVSA